MATENEQRLAVFNRRDKEKQECKSDYIDNSPFAKKAVHEYSYVPNRGYEINKLWIDNGINTEWTGWGPTEHREQKTYCNGIKIEAKRQVKEFRR